MNVVLEATTVNSAATMCREVTTAHVTQAIHRTVIAELAEARIFAV